MTVDYDLEKTYTETFTRAVGATERTNARGTLPQPAPDNTNSIWLTADPLYGSDVNPGTQASPKLTPAGAIAALGGAATNVQIFRPAGSTIDINFTHTGSNLTLPASNSMQVEEGEIATITIQSAHSLVLNAGSKINGLVVNIDFDYRQNLIDADNGASAEIANCTIIAEDPTILTSTSAVPVPLVINESTLVKYCVITSSYHGIDINNTAAGSTGSINNNIFYSRIDEIVNLVEDDIFLTGNTAIHSWANNSGVTITINRNLFVNARNAISDAGDVSSLVGNKLTWNISNCNYYNVRSAFSARSNRATPHYVDINFDYCKLSVIDGIVTAGDSSTQTVSDNLDVGVVVTVSNTISTYLANMFQNEQNGALGDVESFRLQHEGQTIPGGTDKYYVTSPLVGAGASGVDVSPFDESVTYASTAYNKSMDIDYIAQSMTIENVFSNPVQLTDVNGNIHKGYDRERRKFTFTFGDNIHVYNIQIKEMRDMLADNGAKRFFPLGYGGNLFNELGSSNGAFSDTDNSLSPFDTAIVTMVDNYWRGLWVLIGTDRFYISSNDGTKLYLTDKLGVGFPANGNYAFLIDSILVNNEPVPFVYKQNNFTAFTRGGTWRESTEKVRNYDYTIDQFVFMEVEDEEENI